MELSELEDIVFVKNDENEIKKFIELNRSFFIDYMEETFLVLIGQTEAKNIIAEMKNLE